MSEDGDIDVESSEDVPEIGGEATATTANEERFYGGGHDRRAHHNALERRRRDHIKDSFSGLRDCIPSLVGEKVSRAHVLNKATEYIRHMQKSGSTREDDICELARKNEVLEEQVRALEEARTRGANVNAEEILVSVAARVQSRQSQEMITQQQHQAKINSKSKSAGGGGGGGGGGMVTVSKNNTSVPARPTTAPAAAINNDKNHTRGSAATKSTDIPTSASSTTSATSQTAPLPSNISVLASKFKNPQSFLAALQKTGNFPQNIKSLAAYVLASPLIKGAVSQTQTKVTQASTPTIPRGIVTATTVPKGGGVSIPGAKPSASVHVTGNTVNIQQPTPTANSVPPPTPSSPSVTLATLVEEALKKADPGNLAGIGGTTAVSNLLGIGATSASANLLGIGATTTASNLAGIGATMATPNTSANLLSPVQAPPIQPSPVSNAACPSIADTAQLAAQLLEVHNLLQQQQQQTRSPAPPLPRPPPTNSLDRETGGATQGLVGLSPDLLAQVSSILNLPSLSAGGVTPAAASPQVPVGGISLNSQGTLPSPTGNLKRLAPSGGFDNDLLSVKKPLLDQ